MRRSGAPRWLMLLAIAATLAGCCDDGYEWGCCPTGGTTQTSESDGEGPPGPDIDVGGGGEGGEGAPPPSADAAAATCNQIEWKIGGKPAQRGPRSNGEINRMRLDAIEEGFFGYELTGGAEVPLDSFILKYDYMSTPHRIFVKRYHKPARSRDRLEWRTGGEALRSRGTATGDDIPEDFFGCLTSLRGIRSDNGDVVDLSRVSIR